MDRMQALEAFSSVLVAVVLLLVLLGGPPKGGGPPPGGPPRRPQAPIRRRAARLRLPASLALSFRGLAAAAEGGRDLRGGP